MSKMHYEQAFEKFGIEDRKPEPYYTPDSFGRSLLPKYEEGRIRYYSNTSIPLKNKERARRKANAE